MVHPMTSMSGYVAYLKITAGTNKGETKQGDLINSPFQLGAVDRNYTSASVVEAFTTGQTNLAWAPCLTGMFYNTAADGTRTVLGDVKVTTAADPAVSYFGTFASDAARETGLLTGMTFKDSTGTTQSYTIVNGDKIAYAYNNVIIPQNDLPIVNAEMDSIPLIAKARRVAIYYSNLAAFQAKNDYDFDLGEQLATQAVARLNYEIDSETVHLLADGADQNADASAVLTELTWSKTLPVGVKVKLAA